MKRNSMQKKEINKERKWYMQKKERKKERK